MLIARDSRLKRLGGLVAAHLAVAAMVTHATVAFSADYTPPVTVLSDDHVYTVNHDGSSTYDQTRSIRIGNGKWRPGIRSDFISIQQRTAEVRGDRGLHDHARRHPHRRSAKCDLYPSKSIERLRADF
jgi:hypothetical protein